MSDDFVDLARNYDASKPLPKIIIKERERKPRVVKPKKGAEIGSKPLIKDPEEYVPPTEVIQSFPPDLGDDITDDWILNSAMKAQQSIAEPKPYYDAIKPEWLVRNDEPIKVPPNYNSTLNYEFNEGALVQELKDYIDKTYSQHYADGKYQATAIIIDAGHGIGFTLGNVIKYAKRYGKKEGSNRLDLLKMIHYAILALAAHDMKVNNEKK